MRQRQEKTVLFLCTGNYYRSRFAEVLFNSVAGKMGLPWRAAPPAKKEVVKTSGTIVRLGRETKGRRGKGVTTVADLPLDEAGLLELAATLKQRCGTGGTVRDGTIEIQGDQRDRLAAVLEGMGYRVKRVGG